jgi:hypothetical protein
MNSNGLTLKSLNGTKNGKGWECCGKCVRAKRADLADEAARLWADADRLAESDPVRSEKYRAAAERLLRLSQSR